MTQLGNIPRLVLTNQKEQSHHDMLGPRMPMLMQYFAVVKVPSEKGMVVRHLLLDTPYADIKPHINGLWPRDPMSLTGVAEHRLNNPDLSPRISATSSFPQGIPDWQPEKVYIDLEAARKAGVKIYTTEQIAAELNAYKAAHPETAARVDMSLRNLYSIEKEVLLEPPAGKPIPPGAIWKPEHYQLAQRAQVIQVIGLLFTAYNLGAAADQSIREGAIRPIAKESIKQAAGWGTAWMGFKIGAAGGALLTSETGPGALVGGLIGGLICGWYGYNTGEIVGEWLFE